MIYNPFLPLDKYIPDGEPHVFNDRVYLFGSHDRQYGNTFCELDYEFFSAPVDDLSNWTSKGINYKAFQDALYSKERPYMYAPDVVRGNDGRFYLYYCLAGNKGDKGYYGPISVAVADAPDGKYEYLGYVKYSDGRMFNKYVCFDPGLINDDGVIRLYYGTGMPRGISLPKVMVRLGANIFKNIYGKSKEELLEKPGIWGPNMVTLCDDMLTIKDDALRIIFDSDFKGHAFFEGSSIRKINNLYYFIYSSQLNHELCYATSIYPDRGFKYGGTIVSAGDIGINGRKERDSLNAVGTTHGSIEYINGQWYVFYHRLTHGSDYSRQACAEPIVIEDDGSIKQVEISSSGLNGKPLIAKGKYPSVIACIITNGKMPRVSNKKYKKKIPMVKANYITNIDNKTIVGYRYFDFVNDRGSIDLDINNKGFGSIQIYSNNVLIGESNIDKNGRYIVSIPYEISNRNKQELIIKFKGEGTIDLYSLDFKEIL